MNSTFNEEEALATVVTTGAGPRETEQGGDLATEDPAFEEEEPEDEGYDEELDEDGGEELDEEEPYEETDEAEAA